MNQRRGGHSQVKEDEDWERTRVSSRQEVIGDFDGSSWL